MLRLDRYLVMRDRTVDLASGAAVVLRRSRVASPALRLFESRRGRTLIDLDADDRGRIEVWERWRARAWPPDQPDWLAAFVELLECARYGAPRTCEQPAEGCEARYRQRVMAREARVRGWVPVDVQAMLRLVPDRLARVVAALTGRSLVMFVPPPPLPVPATSLVRHLAGGRACPHLVVWFAPVRAGCPCVTVRERGPANDPHSALPAPAPPLDAGAEAEARWQRLLDRLANGAPAPARTLRLARVLTAREQRFEARGLLAPLMGTATPAAAHAAMLWADLNARATARASKGWEMVDDLLDVLRLCQEVEDEHTALARVGAFVRDRLQAASVAFLVREGTTPRVLTRVGSTVASVDLAVRTMDTGLAVAPARHEGPVEASWPVRHASDVIGALWCRWGAGMPIAPEQAASLLGVAAAAAAPSVRLALARTAAPARGSAVPELIGESPAMIAVRDAIMRAAASPFPVIVEGESGSGKELAARAIHTRSSRRDRRFCAINCAALVDDLVEAELFGHTRGAFTGAAAERAGLFEEASGGTLFMDEIAELGARVQATLLRALQEGEIRRVGESLVRKVDVRIVAASNRPLAREVAAGAFRADLWYRLDVVRITLPPLRERLEDMPLLVNHLWRTLAARVGSRAVLSPTAVARLAAYDWPGNIRELQNVLASLLVSAPRTGWIGPAALPSHVVRASALAAGASLADARKQFEQRYVRAALARAGGRTATAARELGLSRQGLTKLIGRLGIDQAAIRSI